MRVGIVLHGPEIVDVGSAKRIIGIFGKEHHIEAKLGGTMGRTAVIDAGLEDVIDISVGLTPGETLNSMKQNVDLAILLNHGKTLDTGRNFGRIVASKIKGIPFVHIERPEREGRIIYYDAQAKRCAQYVKKLLKRHAYDLPIERGKPLPSQVWSEGELVIRRISGACPGESIRLDGVIIGVVSKPEPEIVCRNGKIVELRGIRMKPHGIEKLERREIDLFRARIRTGSIRRSRYKPRIGKVRQGGKIAFIDHCAESTFELVKDAGAVITVGDDTTIIAADILARLGTPVIGIVDGDIDGMLEDSVVPEGSVFIRVREGFDDIVGRKVFEELLEKNLKIENDELLRRILALAGECVVEVVYY